MTISNKVKGMALAGTGATLWGVNGAFADMVFSQFNAPVEWVVGTRLFLAGILILLYAKVILKQTIFTVLKNGKDLLALILFGLIGMIGCQYLFFLSIGMNGAGLATILQFTSPIFIYLFLVLRKEKHVYTLEVFYIICAFVGVFLIVTKGNMQQLDVSVFGLVIGMGSAIGVAFYTLQPRQLLRKYGAPMVVGWGMLIGGGAFQFVQPIWHPGFDVDVRVILYMAFIIIIGTAVAFSCYLASVTYIDASLSNIISALEPLVANILTALFLKEIWTPIQILGITTVIVSVILFANYGERVRAIDLSMLEK